MDCNAKRHRSAKQQCPQAYQDEIRELFQSENDALKDTFLRKHTYDIFLLQVQQFFTPVWKKFETPVLAQVSFLEDSEDKRFRIDAKTLKALFFAWDQSEKAEQDWLSLVEGTHSDIKPLKNEIRRRKSKETHNHSAEKTAGQVQQVIKSRSAASNCKQISLSVNIQQCDEVMKNLKASSRRLYSGLKDEYSDMIVGKAGPSGISNNTASNDDVDDGNDNGDDGDDEDDDDHFAFKRRWKPLAGILDRPSVKKVDKRGKQPLERRSVKRRFNEEQSDAEIVDWESDDDETDVKQKTTKLPRPCRRSCLKVKLPERKPRKLWTAEETRWLEEGVKTFGQGNWAQILKAYNFVGRSSVNLKDRWRTLQKNK